MAALWRSVQRQILSGVRVLAPPLLVVAIARGMRLTSCRSSAPHRPCFMHQEAFHRCQHQLPPECFRVSGLRYALSGTASQWRMQFRAYGPSKGN